MKRQKAEIIDELKGEAPLLAKLKTEVPDMYLGTLDAGGRDALRSRILGATIHEAKTGGVELGVNLETNPERKPETKPATNRAAKVRRLIPYFAAAAVVTAFLMIAFFSFLRENPVISPVVDSFEAQIQALDDEAWDALFNETNSGVLVSGIEETDIALALNMTEDDLYFNMDGLPDTDELIEDFDYWDLDILDDEALQSLL